MGKGKACFQVLAAPEFEASQTDRFPEDPDPFFVPDWRNQWHLRLSSTSRSEAAQFLVAVDLDCTGAETGEPEALEGGGYAVRLGDVRVEIGAAGASARRLGPAAEPPACAVPPKHAAEAAAAD